MSSNDHAPHRHGAHGSGHGHNDHAPGEEGGSHTGIAAGIRGYLIGLVLATGMTIASFAVGGSGLIYAPGIPVVLLVLAVAQMGVHIVFFLHITTGPDNTNNVLALAFGVLIVMLVVLGSVIIMAEMNHNMMPEGMMMPHGLMANGITPPAPAQR